MSKALRVISTSVSEDVYQKIRQVAFDRSTSKATVIRDALFASPLFLGAVERTHSNGKPTQNRPPEAA